jgi:hypothetical protein
MKKYKRTFKVLKDSNGDPLMIEVPHGNTKVSKFNIRFSELQRNIARAAKRSANRILKALKSKD